MESIVTHLVYMLQIPRAKVPGCNVQMCSVPVHCKYVTFHEKTKHNALDCNLRYKPK